MRQVLVLVALLAQPLTASGCECREGFKKVPHYPDDLCFTILPGEYDHTDAKLWCSSYGAALVLPYSQMSLVEAFFQIEENYDGQVHNMWLGYVRNGTSSKDVFVAPGTNDEIPVGLFNKGELSDKGGNRDCSWMPVHSNPSLLAHLETVANQILIQRLHKYLFKYNFFV